MPQDDDAGYKLLFSAPEVVRDMVLGFIPDAWLQGLDYATLEKVPCSFVADDLRQRSDDVVWRVKAGEDWLYLYILIEFQSHVDPFMAVRLPPPSRPFLPGRILEPLANGTHSTILGLNLRGFETPGQADAIDAWTIPLHCCAHNFPVGPR